MIRRELEAAGGDTELSAYLTTDSTIGDARHWLRTVQNARPSTRSQVHRRVALVPVADADLSELYRAAMDPSSGFRWRYRGRTVAPHEFYDLLHASVLAQFMVVGTSDGHRYGLVVAYQPSYDVSTCYVGFLRSSPRTAAGEMFEGMYWFLQHIFTSFPLRKVYAEVPGYNVDQLGLTTPPFVEEGCLVGHDFHGGQYWDLRLYALWREAWESYRARVAHLAGDDPATCSAPA